jgi:hypothetical protein
MTRLLLCTAAILALTASANAQWIMGSGSSPSTHAHAHVHGGVYYGQNRPTFGNHVCRPPVICAAPKQVRAQRSKQPRR